MINYIRIEAKTSSYYAGAVYDVSMVLSPFLGGIIDYVGYRGFLCSACALLTIPVFGILAFTNVPPLVATLWLGVTYSIAGERENRCRPMRGAPYNYRMSKKLELNISIHFLSGQHVAIDPVGGPTCLHRNCHGNCHLNSDDWDRSFKSSYWVDSYRA